MFSPSTPVKLPAPLRPKRTALGELVYQLKYGGKKDAVAAIADVVEEFVRGRWGDEFDVVVPAPPSIVRAFQPLVEIARALATGLAVPLCEDVVKKVIRTGLATSEGGAFC